MNALSQLRKLLLGETWTLPVGVALGLGAAALLESAAGDWWKRGGGFVLLGLVAAALTLSLAGAVRSPRRSSGARPTPISRGEGTRTPDLRLERPAS